MAPIKAVAFDLGGPVVRTPFEMLPHVEGRVGVAAGTFTWRGPFDPQTDPLWRRMQSGAITERDYWRTRAAELAPYTGGSEVRDFFGIAFDASPAEMIRPEAEAFLRDCQEAGYRTGILTNDLRDFNRPGWGADIAFLSAVDVIVDGSVTGVLKPDPRAYRLLLEALGTAPEETLFIDDQPLNVAGAAEVGLRSVWFDVLDPVGSYRRAAGRLGSVAR